MRITNLYNCSCEDCKTKADQLNLSIEDDFKTVLNSGKKAFKRLHEKGSYDPKDLTTEKAYKDLINDTFDVFNFAITDNDMPEVMRTALQDDARLFGGLKTHAQLFEASKLLLDDKGNLKSFSQLSHEYDKLNINYNRNYLSAEYEFAVGSSQMAAKWSEFGESSRYELQYRTAGDNRVREEHAALNGTTLPKEDPFWSSYMPPNGWNCRCTVVEVLKGKFETSDSEKAIKAGEAATSQIGKDGKNRLEIFRFNPGADKVVFPPAHPYNKVAGAKVVVKELKKEKYVLDEKSIKDLEKRNFNLDLNDDGIKLFNEKFKGFNFSELDDSMGKSAKKFNLNFDKKIIESDDTAIYFKYLDTKKGFILERKLFIKDDLKTVYHSYFQIDKELQGGGISKEIFKNLNKQYKNAELDKITVHANLDVGGYTWGRYGFQASNMADVNDIYKKAKKLVGEGVISKDNLKHFEESYEDFNKNGKSFDMHRISSSEYGKKLLLKTEWRGELNLKDKVQTKIFEDYLGY